MKHGMFEDEVNEIINQADDDNKQQQPHQQDPQLQPQQRSHKIKKKEKSYICVFIKYSKNNTILLFYYSRLNSNLDHLRDYIGNNQRPAVQRTIRPLDRTCFQKKN